MNKYLEPIYEAVANPKLEQIAGQLIVGGVIGSGAMSMTMNIVNDITKNQFLAPNIETSWIILGGVAFGLIHTGIRQIDLKQHSNGENAEIN